MYYCRSTAFRAFIGYLQTDCVTFAPLYPEIDDHVPDSLLVDSILPSTWACSPSKLLKAYGTRTSSDASTELLHPFAGAYNVKELVKKCEAAYVALLRPKIALRELADKFARMHPAILAVVEKYALANWVRLASDGSYVP